MKYIIVLIGIIGIVTYVFVGGPKKVLGRDAPPADRLQAVTDKIAELEYRRRDMLIRTHGRLGVYSPAASLSRGGAYAAGWREGFSQGYFEGSFLAEGRRPNPLFFAIP